MSLSPENVPETTPPGAKNPRRTSRSQRRRWEHGFLATALREAPRLIASGVFERSRLQLALGMHLLVPPLALLFLISFLALVITGAFGLAGLGWSATLAVFASLFMASSATFVVWAREGRAWLTPRALLRAPLYVLWKIPLYARFIVAPETRWIRTRRVKD